MNLFDSHSHYNDEKFDLDREEVIRQTKEHGISNFIVAGYNIESSIKAVQISNNYDGVYSIIGISPNDIEYVKKEEEIQDNINKIEEIYMQDLMFKNKDKQKTSIVGIGEIGLDYYWNKENKDIQKKVFIKQIELANKLKLPIIIHTREAVNDTIDILKKNIVTKKGIFHCCPLNRELIKEALKLGYYISLSGVITFKNSKNADEIINMVPEDKLLIETDSPYLSPEPVRGTRNNSINIRYIAQKIADVKNKTLEEIAIITSDNTKKIFEIEK